NDITLDDGPSDASSAVDDMEIEDDATLGADEEMEVGDEDDVPDFFKEAADRRAKKLEGNPNRKKRGKVAELVRNKVKKVLEVDSELADKRARMCDEGDFLKLLYSFNQEGIHFS
ncbi:hypothetical protein LTR28_012405, partial [Elasticomyces elasticus]